MGALYTVDHERESRAHVVTLASLVIKDGKDMTVVGKAIQGK